MKEGKNLRDVSTGDTLDGFGDGGNVYIKAFVNGTQRFALCAPPARYGSGRSATDPRWARESGEFIAAVSPEDQIRFELSCVDEYGGVASLGACAIQAAEVLASAGERLLPVMIDSEQYGSLGVDFEKLQGPE